jgi:hypothetical protein
MFQNLQRMLRGGRSLQLTCCACGHAASWTPEEAFRRAGAEATPMDLRRRLTCSQCGSRQAIATI